MKIASFEVKRVKINIFKASEIEINVLIVYIDLRFRLTVITIHVLIFGVE